MSMALVLLTFLVILAVAAVVIRHQYGWVRAHDASTGGVRNCNDRMTEFRYSVPMAPEQILDCLEIPNAQDPLAYEFERETLRLRFFDPLTLAYSPCPYQLTMEAGEGETLLTVRQLGILSKGKYPYLQNEFWTKKLGAHPIKL